MQPRNYIPSFEGKQYQHMHVQSKTNTIEYDYDRACIGAIIIAKLNTWCMKTGGVAMVQTYTLKKRLKKFQTKGHTAVFDEMKQLHD